MCVCTYPVMSDSLWPHGLFSLPGSSVHGNFQARILQWAAISSSEGSSLPRDWTYISFTAGRFFTADPWGKPSKHEHYYRHSGFKVFCKPVVFFTQAHLKEWVKHWQEWLNMMILPCSLPFRGSSSSNALGVPYCCVLYGLHCNDCFLISEILT